MQLNLQSTLLVGHVFGQVDVVGRANARISAQTVESFTPELASTFRGIFTTVFGRRLGTVDDGTSLCATPKLVQMI